MARIFCIIIERVAKFSEKEDEKIYQSICM